MAEVVALVTLLNGVGAPHNPHLHARAKKLTPGGGFKDPTNQVCAAL